MNELHQTAQALRQTAQALYDTFTEEQKREAKRLFGEFDTNGDGKLCIYEFEKIVGTYDFVKFTFQQLDTDGDGKLDFQEFKTILLLIRNDPNQLRHPAPASPRTEKQRGRKRKKIKEALKTLFGICSVGAAVASVAQDYIGGS